MKDVFAGFGMLFENYFRKNGFKVVYYPLKAK